MYAREEGRSNAQHPTPNIEHSMDGSNAFKRRICHGVQRTSRRHAARINANTPANLAVAAVERRDRRRNGLASIKNAVAIRKQ